MDIFISYDSKAYVITALIISPVTSGRTQLARSKW